MLFERVNPKRVPSFLGWFNPADKDHRRVLAEADLLITLEDRNLYPRVVGELPTPRKLAITSNRRKVVKNQYLRDQDRVVEGNVVDILHSLTASIVRKIGQRQAWYSTRFGEFAERASIPHTVYRARSSLIDVLGEAMRNVENPIIIDDSQMFGGLVSTEYDRLPDHVRVFGDHGGFVGGGLAYATGLAISDANLRVFCLLGDQGFTNAIQGLVAAKQERARVTYIVCNNGESVSLFTQAAISCPGSFENGNHSFLKNIEGFEYARLAEGMGIDAFVVEFPTGDDPAAVKAALSSLTMALKSAATIQGPVLIELRLPARGDFWDGIWITSGFEETKSGTLPALPA